MNHQAIGLLQVSTPGTPVQVTSLIPAASLLKPRYMIHGVLFQARPTNAGLVYIGEATMDRTALTGLFAVLPAPSGGPPRVSIPSFSVAITIAPNGLRLEDYWVDVDTAEDGVLVSVLVA